ncbi:XRE family transcriptional regulator [Streptococcus sp. sy010]|uniref:XRE family transcriptional regulator n=1 Tax=Streptococcus sp. sy010 TaxID=2600148 RepID=UPI0011B50A4E|nr:helix-turn-helix domain-containing protein [Streptococcus sp. sy010]TWT16423.1 helix-turn-helix domain-containing protein [Streptococcus sp. sy010]
METQIAFPAMVKEYRTANNLTMEQLADKIGKTKSTISKWEKGTRSPKIQEIEEIANFFNVEPAIMMFGAITTDTPAQAPSELVTAITETVTRLHPERQEIVLDVATEQLEEQLREQANLIEEDNDPVELYEVITTTKLAAGYGYSFDDYDQNKEYVENEPPRHDIASLVSGDSMLPDYEDGDIVYLRDAGFSHYNGQVCAIVVDDQTFIKKVYTEDGGLRLVSINPDYPDKWVDFPPSEDTHIKVFLVVGSDTPVSH